MKSPLDIVRLYLKDIGARLSPDLRGGEGIGL